MEGTIVIVQVEHPTPVAVPEDTENESFDKSFVSAATQMVHKEQRAERAVRSLVEKWNGGA